MSATFSCICVTGGRTHLLEEAIAQFVRQDYGGESELVILNTVPQQQLELGNGYDNVRIINLSERPKSLGDARNMAIAEAEHDWIITYDDDDSYLPWHLSNYAEHADGKDWLWLSRQFYVEGFKLKGIVQGSMNVVAFRKEVWDKIGGYSALSVGEDRAFVGKLTTQFNGKKVELTDERISFLYGWGQSIYHISGMGDDTAGRKSSWERAEKHLSQQIALRKIPTGTVRLEPQLRHDYEGMTRRFVGATQKPDTSKGSVGVVMLGRYGDIINLLPFLKHVADNYAKPHLVISREFASILEGVSYVEPYPIDQPYDQLLPAIKIAERNYRHVIVGQTWGRGWSQPKLTDAYNKESWRQCGFLHRWNDASLVPVFDRRNLAREEALFTKLNVPDKPMLLYKLDGGLSSPCPECPTLAGPIREAFGELFNVINLSDVKAERMFDLLGLFDRAACLVTIDTSLAHLAAASRVPYVLLANPLPWLGTSPRGNNCAARLTYTEALAKPRALVTLLEMTFATENAEVSDQRGAGSLH